MGWVLAVVHPCSWRSNSRNRSTFDWHRNKGHAEGHLFLWLTMLKTCLKREDSLRLASLVAIVLVMK